jgi:hypothetical protein
MKKWWLIGLLLVIALGAISILLGPDRQTLKESATNLPWKIEITPTGTTRVFDIEIGAITVEEVGQKFKLSPEIALFRAPDGSYRLESYLGKIKLGPLQARVILRLDASDELMEEFKTNSTSSQTTPSGNHQFRLSGDDFERANKLIVNELSYSPAVNTEAELLENLFGEPQQRITIDANSAYWLYPQRGLALLVNADDKEIFHYVPPRDFEQVLARIEVLRVAKETIPKG